MASARAKITFRVLLAVLVFFFFLFYLGRPLYWKISATIDDIRQNKRTVQQGISQIMLEAQKVWRFHDEADSGLQHDHSTRKLLSEVL